MVVGVLVVFISGDGLLIGEEAGETDAGDVAALAGAMAASAEGDRPVCAVRDMREGGLGPPGLGLGLIRAGRAAVDGLCSGEGVCRKTGDGLGEVGVGDNGEGEKEGEGEVVGEEAVTGEEGEGTAGEGDAGDAVKGEEGKAGEGEEGDAGGGDNGGDGDGELGGGEVEEDAGEALLGTGGSDSLDAEAVGADAAVLMSGTVTVGEDSSLPAEGASSVGEASGDAVGPEGTKSLMGTLTELRSNGGAVPLMFPCTQWQDLMQNAHKATGSVHRMVTAMWFSSGSAHTIHAFSHMCAAC